MSTFEQITLCRPVDRAAFMAAIGALRHIASAEVPTEAGRLVLVRAGDDRGPLVGYRDEYLDRTAFYLR